MRRRDRDACAGNRRKRMDLDWVERAHRPTVTPERVASGAPSAPAPSAAAGRGSCAPAAGLNRMSVSSTAVANSARTGASASLTVLRETPVAATATRYRFTYGILAASWNRLINPHTS